MSPRPGSLALSYGCAWARFSMRFWYQEPSSSTSRIPVKTALKKANTMPPNTAAKKVTSNPGIK